MFDVYKVLTINEWKNALNLGYIETILDKEDGFVHLSTSKQLVLTLNPVSYTHLRAHET